MALFSKRIGQEDDDGIVILIGLADQQFGKLSDPDIGTRTFISLYNLTKPKSHERFRFL